jgi:ribonuclease HI
MRSRQRRPLIGGSTDSYSNQPVKHVRKPTKDTDFRCMMKIYDINHSNTQSSLVPSHIGIHGNTVIDQEVKDTLDNSISNYTIV